MSVASISRYVLQHKLQVVSAWLVVFLAGVVLLPWANGQLTSQFTMPGTESSRANAEIIEKYGSGGYVLPIVPVVTLPDGMTVDSPGIRDQLQAVFDRAQSARPEARVVSWASTGDDVFVSPDRRTTYGLIFLRDDGDGSIGDIDVQFALSGMTVAGAPVHLTGFDLLDNSADARGDGGSSVFAETMIGGIGALVILLYVFGSALALLPILIAAFAIISSFLVIGLVGSVVDINNVVQYLVALIGLGVAIDYSLLVVNRWREERRAGFENEVAVQRAMETAGHAVLFSGTTVGVGLLALVALPMPLFRGIGIGGMVIPFISVLVTITLLPIILAKIGPRFDWPRFRTKRAPNAGWLRFGQTIIRHRWLAAGVGLILLGVLAGAASTIELGSARPDALNSTGEPRIGLNALETSGIQGGVLAPIEVIVHGDPTALAARLSEVKGIDTAVAPQAWRADDTSLIMLIPDGDGGGNQARALMSRVRAVTHQHQDEALVGGAGAFDADFTNEVYSRFPITMAIIAFVTFLLLVRAFRSVILPLKALALNVLSIGAAYGLLVLVWQRGWGSDLIWGIPATGAITAWVPIMAFAFLFGLSMDYEVFILHRMREEYDHTRDTNAAVVRGLGHTGKLVTCAALILVLAFASMASSPETDVRMIATGLAAGILIDATIVRILLVPALISLMGSWNWWLPGWLKWFASPDQHLTIDAAQVSPAD